MTTTKRPDGGELKSNADYCAGLERAAKYHDDAARDCDAIAAVNQDNDFGPDCITAAADHRIAADEIRLLKSAPAPQPPVEGLREALKPFIRAAENFGATWTDGDEIELSAFDTAIDCILVKDFRRLAAIIGAPSMQASSLKRTPS